MKNGVCGHYASKRPQTRLWGSYTALIKTQLVLQFKTDGFSEDFERLVSFEEALSLTLTDLAEVDGHDFGSGEMNIFILTDDPIATFNLVRQTDESTRPSGEMKTAYRRIDGENYVCLWPPELSRFQLA